jgi:CDP-4-dehydro-6-deoxyglucose reductase
MGRVLSGQVHYADGRPPGLSVADEEMGRALFCQARPLSDLTIEVREIGAAADIPVRVLPCRVARLERLAEDVMGLHLRLPGSERLQFLAGQYLDILLKDGRRRGFSLANAPHDDQLLELHIRHVPGGRFTDQVFGAMKEKALLRFEGPLGAFHLDEESDRPMLLVGGGTGFAPLKSILEHAFHIGHQVPMHLFWGVRARRDLYLAELPEAWARSRPDFRYTPVLSEPDAADAWAGETGFVHEAVLRSYPDLRDFDVYMSGPPVMIEAARRDFLARGGLPEDRLFYDSFEYSADTLKALRETPPG